MGDIINSTFIGNRASQGDAIYNYEFHGAVDRCIFVNNTANSMIYGAFSEMTVSNSIIVNNYGEGLINIQDPTLVNNWWGTTADDEEAPVVSGDTPDNYYILDMTVDDDSADITLNNLCDNGVMTTSYGGYALPSINFTIKGNVEVPDSVVLGANGEASVQHSPVGAYEITICYNGVELTREVKPSFKWLNDKINESSEISLDQDIIYGLAKDFSLDKGIEFAKDMTIDGQGHIIDAMESSNIIYFDDDTNSYSLTLKNIIFANATGVNASVVGQPDAAVNVAGNAIKVSNLNVGNYTLTVTTIADGNHNPVTKTAKITVNKVNSTLTVGNVVLVYGDSTNVTVTTEGATGVVAKINGDKADVNGNTIVIPVLDVGIYTLTVTTIADGNHNNVTKTATITVNKIKTQLSAGAITTTYNVNKNLLITLKDANGKPLTGVNVTVNLNGAKIYAADKNGQVKVATKGLAAKTYTAKIAFNGNAIHAKSTKDVKVTVKKATPKLTAKSNTFKVKKAKKYTVILKNNVGITMKKVRLTIKVGKKTYSATTNSKGKATFNLKLTKKANTKRQ